MKNLKHFFHFHKGEPRHRAVKILGSLLIGVTLMIWSSAQSLVAAKNQTISILTQTVPEPQLEQTALLNVAQVYKDKGCTPLAWQAAQFDVIQLKKELGKITRYSNKLGEKTQETHELNATLSRFEELLNAPPQEVTCAILEKYWDSNVTQQVEELRNNLLLPHTLNTIKKEIEHTQLTLNTKGIQQELTSARVVWSIIEGAHDLNKSLYTEALARYEQKNIAAAAESLSYITQKINPSTMASSLEELYEVRLRTSHITDTTVREHLDAVTKPIVDHINALEFEEALTQAQEINTKLKQLMPLIQHGATAQVVLRHLHNNQE